MKLWVERSGKERGTVYAAAEQDGVSVFAALHVGARELASAGVHAAGIFGAAAMLRRLKARKKRVKMADKDVRRMEKYAARQFKSLAKSLRR